jgi:hypothetical protein
MKGAADSLHLRRFALRDLLLGVQIAICTLLVTSSLVAVRGMVRTLDTPLGINPRGALLADIGLNELGVATVEKKREIIEAARTIPGVTAVGSVSRTPMTGGMRGVPVYRPGTTEFTLKNYALAPYVFTLSPGYLEAAGTRRLAGRDVSWHDTATSPYVAIVNQTFVRQMWGAQLRGAQMRGAQVRGAALQAIGQRFLLRGNLTEVVGVAEDGKYHDLAEAPQAVVYLPLPQGDQNETVFVLRSRLTATEMAAALQRTVHALEPNVSITLRNWSDDLESELFPAKAATVALGVMGLLAAMLAVTGIFGMAAYSVSRRMRELGIRVALGARRQQVMSAAVGRPILLLFVGSAVGLLSGFLASRLLGQIVYQADPANPLVVGGAVLTMAVLGLAASALPARRALAADPSRLMREE